MILLETIAVAFSLFSAVPMPQFVWTERNLRYSLCAFPLVGVLIAFLWTGAAMLPLPDLLRGAVLCLIPVLLTGGIHLDGYCDTWDARSSHGSAEQRQTILKDPHCGAFAVIHLGCWFVADFALCASLRPEFRDLLCMGLGFVLSRALSGWAIAALPMAKNTGLAHTFASAADKVRVRWILGAAALLLLAAQAVLGRRTGLLMAAAALFTLWRYTRVAKREFGGISGDLAGWFLTTCELWQLGALVLGQLWEAYS